MAEIKWNPVETKHKGEYCIKDKQIHEKGFADHIADHLKKEDAERICNAVNNYDNMKSSIQNLIIELQRYDKDWDKITYNLVEIEIQLLSKLNNLS